MKRTVVIWLSAVAVVGCKGETKVEDSSETLSKLESCAEASEEKDKYIKELETRLSDLEMDGDAVVVRIEGGDMTISGKGPHRRASSGGGAGDADDAELYKAFLAQTRESRGAIKKCYQGALKKDTSIQATAIQLEIAVDYKPSGGVTSATFDPNVSRSFNQCMKSVTQRWDIPASPRPVTFMRKITLTPE